MEQSAAQLSAFVDRVLAATGARKVDIVGHSEGATMPDYYIEYLGGAAKVARYVGVSGVKHGTTLHGIGTFVTAFESLFPGAPDPDRERVRLVRPSSSSARTTSSKIEARAPVAGVIYTNISTRYDELVSPYTSSFLSGPNVTNITLQDHCALDFSDHLSIISSPITGQYILNALDPAHARTTSVRAGRARGLAAGRHRRCTAHEDADWREHRGGWLGSAHDRGRCGTQGRGGQDDDVRLPRRGRVGGRRDVTLIDADAQASAAEWLERDQDEQPRRSASSRHRPAGCCPEPSDASTRKTSASSTARRATSGCWRPP